MSRTEVKENRIEQSKFLKPPDRENSPIGCETDDFKQSQIARLGGLISTVADILVEVRLQELESETRPK